jgi:TonB family protein
MSSRRQHDGGSETRPALLVALLISLLLHYPLVAGIAALTAHEPAAPEKRLRQEEPPEPPRPPRAEPRPEPPAEPPSAPLAERQRVAPQPTPAPSAAPAGAPTAPPAADPLGTPAPVAEAAEVATPPAQVELEMDFAMFERTFAVEAEQERQAYQQESQSKRRGGLKFGSLTGRVKGALHDNSSWVASGQQEPLGKRQRTFRNYIHAIHDRIHYLFADSFLGSLTSLDPADPLNNFDLMAKLEFEILKSGQISEVHVIRSSGNTVFDAAAVDSIYRSSPYQAPPRDILSWNERVYMRWAFFRNNRKCGPFNAEPYILRAPDAAPEQLPVDDIMIDDG